MKSKKGSKLSISAYNVKRRNQLAFFLSSIIPLVFLSYLGISMVFPELELGSRNMMISAGFLMIIFLLILSLSGYYMTIKDTEHLIARAENLSSKIAKVNDIALRNILNPTDDIRFSLNQALETAIEVTPSDSGAILIFDENGMFSYASVAGTDIENLEGVYVPAKLGIVGFCFNNRRGYYTNDTSQDSLFDLRSDRIGTMNIERTLVVPIYQKGEPLGVIQLVNNRNMDEYSDVDLNLVQNLSLQATSFMKSAEGVGAKRNYITEAAGIISTMLEANGLGKDHHKRVAKYADLMGEMLLDNSMEKEDLHLAALLHDIGLVFIDPNLRGNAEIYQRHPSIGADLLKKIPLWRNASICVQHHHENFNGTGYPEGLAGEDIPLSSRILGIAEYYDYLTNDSFGKDRLTPDEAKYEIINCSGTYFDPKVVEAFAQVFDYFDKVD